MPKTTDKNKYFVVKERAVPEVLLNVVPREHFEELVEVLFDLLFRELLLVDDVEPAFEEGVGQCEVRLVEQHPADVERKEEIGFAAQVAADLGVDVLCELICVLHVAFREGHLEKLVVQFRLGEAADFGDRQRNARNIPASRTTKKATLYNSARKHSNTARKTLKVSQ